MESDPRIVTIGGGTGSATVLTELKHASSDITAIVNMSDDGGSSGILRRQLGVMPPGDVRQCLVALSSEGNLKDLFNHRLTEGVNSGHPVGNLMLSSFEQSHGGFDRAVDIASKLLKISGQVLPVTLDDHEVALYDGDRVTRGEKAVADQPIANHSAYIQLEPTPKITDRAEQAILDAEMIVIPPGNLYGSILPALAVRGLSETIQQSKAHKVMITNLLNNPAQTAGWHVVDHVKRVEQYVGSDLIDAVLYNSAPPGEELLAKHAAVGEAPLDIEPGKFDDISAYPVGVDLVSSDIFKPVAADVLKRTRIRHDSSRVTEALMYILRRSHSA